MRRPFLVLLLLGSVVFAAGCRDKQPYPGAEQIRQKLVQQVQKPEGDEGPAKAPVLSRRVLALIHTARGTTIVSGQSDGGSLSTRQVPGHAWATPDGVLRVARTDIRPFRQVTSRKRSVSAGLVMDEYFPDGRAARSFDLTPELTAARSETEAALAEALGADPDMAGEFYHVEQLRMVGSSGSRVAWMYSVESWLGGAHPVDSRRLIVVDMETAAVVDTVALFGGRDLPREVLKDGFDAACVRAMGGAAPVEGTGGGPLWAVMLTADFGVCEGKWDVQFVAPPASETRTPQGHLILDGQSLSHPGGAVVEKGVLDFRASPDGRTVVMEMGMGIRDEKNLSWSSGRDRSERTREVRFLIEGMGRPAVISRLPEIMSVQFQPDNESAERLLDAVEAMKP